MKTFSFEKLIVWQESREFTLDIYRITKDFPDYEKYDLVRQIRRCCISIVSNIAEGSARTQKNDKARFMEIAFGSLMELLNQLIISNDLGYISDEDLINSRAEIEKIGNKLNALRKSFLK